MMKLIKSFKSSANMLKRLLQVMISSVAERGVDRVDVLMAALVVVVAGVDVDEVVVSGETVACLSVLTMTVVLMRSIENSSVLTKLVSVSGQLVSVDESIMLRLEVKKPLILTLLISKKQ